MSKGVLGLGCSYTWGEGLYYYSDLDGLPFKYKHEFVFEDVKPSMIQYKNKHRFIQLIADHYDTWAWANRGNGGTNVNCIRHYVDNEFLLADEFKYSDFKLVVFQFTHFGRDDFEGKDIKEQIEVVNRALCKFEKQGCKVVTFCWDEEIPSQNLYRELFKHRHIDITIDGVTKPGFDYFVWNDKFNITIASDFKKKNLQVNDLHFNHRGHRIIADSIIKKLEQDNFKIKKKSKLI